MKVIAFAEVPGSADDSASSGRLDRQLDDLGGRAVFDAAMRCTAVDPVGSTLWCGFGTEDSMAPIDVSGRAGGALTFTAPELSDSGPVAEVGGALFVIGFKVAPEALDDFDAWYRDEHVRLLLKADGWLRIRRYDVSGHRDAPWNRLAVHDLRSPETWDCPERAAARTPWRDRLAANAWFDSKRSAMYVVDRRWSSAAGSANAMK
jgi:hypothetical protein